VKNPSKTLLQANLFSHLEIRKPSPDDPSLLEINYGNDGNSSEKEGRLEP